MQYGVAGRFREQRQPLQIIELFNGEISLADQLSKKSGTQLRMLWDGESLLVICFANHNMGAALP
jgi:hypothetical protein